MNDEISDQIPTTEYRTPNTEYRSLVTSYGLLVTFILLFTVAYGTLSITRHRNFNSTGYDLAIMEQIVWNTAHGRPFASSPEVDNSFADHFRPILALMVPLYLLHQSPETLLIIQVIALGLGAVPVYQLARDKLHNDWAALIMAAVYLLTPSLGFIARFDFHVDAFVIPAFLAAVLMIERQKWGWASFWLLIPLLCKENMGLSVAAVGIWVLVKELVPRPDRFPSLWSVSRPSHANTVGRPAAAVSARIGFSWIAIGLATFLLTSFVLIPAVRGEAVDALGRYAWVSAPNRLQAGWELLWQEPRPETLRQLFLPTAFLALIALPELIMIAPGLAQNLLADHFCQPTIYCHYTAPVIPFIIVASIFGLAAVNRWLVDGRWSMVGGQNGHHNRLSIALPLLMLLLSGWAFWQDNPFTTGGFLPQWQTPPDNAALVEQALDAVPADGVLVTTNDYAPHLAQRPGLFIIGVPSQRAAPAAPDLLFLNLYDQQYILCDQIRAYVETLDVERYGTLFRTGGLIVIGRDQGDQTQFADFVGNWNNCAG